MLWMSLQRWWNRCSYSFIIYLFYLLTLWFLLLFGAQICSVCSCVDFGPWFLVCVHRYVGNSDGGVGSVVDGVSFPEYQAVCGELFTHGSQTAGIQRTWFASAGHQLGKFVWVWLNKPANAFLNLCRRSERFRWKTRNGFDCYSAIYFMVFFFFFSPLLRCFSLSLYSLLSSLSLSLSHSHHSPHSLSSLNFMLYYSWSGFFKYVPSVSEALQRFCCIELFRCFKHCIIYWRPYKLYKLTYYLISL